MANKIQHRKGILNLSLRPASAARAIALVFALLVAYGKKTHIGFRGRGVYPTKGSCRFPLIVLQQTTQSFLATHNSVILGRSSIRQGEQEPVLLALVIALLVVMGHVLLQDSAQRLLPNKMSFDKHSCFTDLTQRSA